MSVYQKYYINLESIKESLIEGFVAIYGEKHRQTIIERINNMYINTYITADDLRRHMWKLEDKKSAELTVEFLEKQGIELTEEQIEGVLDGRYDQLTEEQKNFLQICFGDKKYSKINNGDFRGPNYDISNDWLKEKEDNRMVKILSLLGANVTVENYKEKLQDGSLDDILQRIEKIKKDIADADEKFMLFQEQYNEEYEEIKKSEKIENQLIEKADIDYLDEIKVLLPKEEQEKIENLLEVNKYWRYKSEYFDMSVKREILIESFTQEAEEILASGDEYDQDTIKRRRIEYFKLKGIDLGNNYEDYLNSKEAQKLKPDIRIG